MKQKIRSLNTLFCLIGALLLSSCIILVNSVNGSGFIIKEERAVSNVTSVVLSGVGDLRIRIGEFESLIIETDDNLMSNITTQQNGSTLIIDTNRGIGLNPSKDIIYTLVVKDLKSIELTGAGNISAVNIDSNIFTAKLFGAGNMNLGGYADSLIIEHGGTGNIKALNLQASKALVRLSGVGNVEVWAEETLDVKLSGIGDVEYRGHPFLTTSVSGLGSVTRKR